MTNITKAAQQALEALYAMAEGSTKGFAGSNASWGRIVMPTDSALNKAESAITALRAALQDKAGEVRQFRRVGCADWYDGNPDHEDGRGPYEARTLYTTKPAPVVPDGFALVPVEPTEAMIVAAQCAYWPGMEVPNANCITRAVKAAMIAASQQKGGSAASAAAWHLRYCCELLRASLQQRVELVGYFVSLLPDSFGSGSFPDKKFAIRS